MAPKQTVRVSAYAVWTLLLLAGWIGCWSRVDEPRSDPATTAPSRPDLKGEKNMTLELTSKAFGEEERIPVKYTGEGEDVSPPLDWTGVPPETKEYALICDDPDAPTEEPWVHWVIYKIPAEASGLAEGVPREARLKAGGVLQGQNSWSSPGKPSIGYRGPMPPPGHGTHHYHFTLYALDSKIVAEPGETKKQLLAEIEGHALATARLTGLYSR